MHLLDRSKNAFAILALGASLIGCKTEQKQQNTSIFDRKSAPPAAYYVHCDTCNWCKGPYKKSVDAQRLCSDHNIQKHEYFKVAYYDAIKCKR